MKISRLIIGLLLFEILSTALAFAGAEMKPPLPLYESTSGKMQCGMENPPPPPMMVNLIELQKLMDEIKIDKSVSSRIITISRAFIKNLDAKILKIQREELNIREELLKDHPDLSLIKNAIGRKTQVLGEIELSQIKRDLDIKALLTPEQYELLKSSMRTRMPPMPGACFEGPGSRERNGTPPEHR